MKIVASVQYIINRSISPFFRYINSKYIIQESATLKITCPICRHVYKKLSVNNEKEGECVPVALNTKQCAICWETKECQSLPCSVDNNQHAFCRECLRAIDEKMVNIYELMTYTKVPKTIYNIAQQYQKNKHYLVYVDDPYVWLFIYRQTNTCPNRPLYNTQLTSEISESMSQDISFGECNGDIMIDFYRCDYFNNSQVQIFIKKIKSLRSKDYRFIIYDPDRIANILISQEFIDDLYKAKIDEHFPKCNRLLEKLAKRDKLCFCSRRDLEILQSLRERAIRRVSSSQLTTH